MAHALALPAVLLAAVLAARSSKVPITATLGGAALWTAAVASAAAVPAALGAARVLLTGTRYIKSNYDSFALRISLEILISRLDLNGHYGLNDFFHVHA